MTASSRATPDGGSFQRGLRVLVAVAELGEARAADIARDAELPLSTVGGSFDDAEHTDAAAVAMVRRALAPVASGLNATDPTRPP